MANSSESRPPAATERRDPYAWYEVMRRTAPVRYDPGRNRWDVFRYDDALRVLQDHETFSSDVSVRYDGTSSGALGSSILAMDPPRHRQLRSLVSRAFTAKAVADLAPRIAAITRDLLDRVIGEGEMDLVEDLAYPLPVTVIAELLGIPSEDRARFKEWSDVVVGSSRGREAKSRAHQDLGQYFVRVVEQRRRRPGDDLISGLLDAEVDGAHLSIDELLGFCVLLLVAGHETTTNLIANAVLCFAENPEVVDRARQMPSLFPMAIEEVLRYRSPVQAVHQRFAAVDCQVGDCEIARGQQVVVWLGSANRDEAKFPDAAQFVADRTPNPHLAFGHGIHFCLGAPLARLEARIALSALLERCRDLELIDRTPELIQSVVVYGPKCLRIRFRGLPA